MQGTHTDTHGACILHEKHLGTALGLAITQVDTLLHCLVVTRGQNKEVEGRVTCPVDHTSMCMHVCTHTHTHKLHITIPSSVCGVMLTLESDSYMDIVRQESTDSAIMTAATKPKY